MWPNPAFKARSILWMRFWVTWSSQYTCAWTKRRKRAKRSLMATQAGACRRGPRLAQGSSCITYLFSDTLHQFEDFARGNAWVYLNYPKLSKSHIMAYSTKILFFWGPKICHDFPWIAPGPSWTWGYQQCIGECFATSRCIWLSRCARPSICCRSFMNVRMFVQISSQAQYLVCFS